MDASTVPREWFAAASAAVVEVVADVPDDAWAAPGLGEWSVRELVAHTLRAWTTLRDYLADPVPPADSPVLTAAQYLAGGLTVPGIHEGVAQRARDEVATLGEDPSSVVRELAGATTALVDGLPDDRLLPTRFGVLTLAEYLRTRAFELTVHGLDVVRATGQPAPAALTGCAAPALALVAEVAGERGMAVPLLTVATGRGALPDGYSLME
jgi:uncharacterized protein (TIGR03083 family)